METQSETKVTLTWKKRKSKTDKAKENVPTATINLSGIFIIKLDYLRFEKLIYSREKSEIPRERWKTLLAFGYSLVVSWVTAFVMVIVHDRVPDMQKYPPLPDILLGK